MDTNNISVTKELISFIDKAPTAFHAVQEIANMLIENGFSRVLEQDEWKLEPGGRYFVTRNQSSIIAFAIPKDTAAAFTITASHTDSPTYKLKMQSETDAFGKYVKLNVEGYGGMIASSWLDRPLSIAGRLLCGKNGTVETRLVKIDRDLVLIPNVAIHQNRTINSGYNYNPAVDLLPLFGAKDQKGTLKAIVAEAAGCSADDVIGSDLYLYNRTPGSVWGADNEFFSCPRIDNLQCAYTTLRGFIDAVTADECGMIPVFSSFDNEETGSATKQGAASSFLHDTLSRVCDGLSIALPCALASSFMVSADNGHARHPNHPELSDGLNVPHMNEGVVIKSNAGQKYTTDGVSAGIFAQICEKAGVPVQYFANRSDMPGGSTLGSISNTNVALNTVDIGLAQLAMHSSYETGGCADTQYMIQAIHALYRARIKAVGDGAYQIEL